MKPHYKELAHQNEIYRHMQFRRDAAHKHAQKFGVQFAVSVMFMNPIIFDVRGERRDEEQAKHFRAVRDMGFFFTIGEN